MAGSDRSALPGPNAPATATDAKHAAPRRLWDESRFRTVRMRERFACGPFDCEPIRVTHSIPDCCGLILRSAYGNIVHTGDWKIDEEPTDGDKFDRDAFEQIGKEGVALFMRWGELRHLGFGLPRCWCAVGQSGSNGVPCACCHARRAKSRSTPSPQRFHERAVARPHPVGAPGGGQHPPARRGLQGRPHRGHAVRIQHPPPANYEEGGRHGRHATATPPRAVRPRLSSHHDVSRWNLLCVLPPAGRKMCFIGTSLNVYLDAAFKDGRSSFSPSELIHWSELDDYDPKQVFIVTTGSQAEPRAALSLAAQGASHALKLDPEDLILYSAKARALMAMAGVEVCHRTLFRPLQCTAPETIPCLAFNAPPAPASRFGSLARLNGGQYLHDAGHSREREARDEDDERRGAAGPGDCHGPRGAAPRVGACVSWGAGGGA